MSPGKALTTPDKRVNIQENQAKTPVKCVKSPGKVLKTLDKCVKAESQKTPVKCVKGPEIVPKAQDKSVKAREIKAVPPVNCGSQDISQEIRENESETVLTTQNLRKFIQVQAQETRVQTPDKVVMPQETRGEAEDILSSRQKQKLVEISHQSWLGNVNTQQIATTANCDVHKSSECQIASVSVAEPGVKSSLPENLHGSSVCASKDKSTCSINSTASSECATKPVLPQLPERRKLKPFPEGVVTQQEGEAYCKYICDAYPEVFDGERGEFLGAEATMFVKEGHLDILKKMGARPASKVPYGLEEEYEKKLDELYEDCIPVDGRDIITASQIVPVCTTKDGKKVLKRLAINYKNTINDHLEDLPHVFTTCSEELDKLKGEFRTCIDLKGAFKQIKITPGFSQQICAIVTPRGYAVPTRMQFGIKTAPSIWNSNMSKLIHGMNGRGPLKAAVMVDDVCLTGKSAKEHFENVHEFVYRLWVAGLKANIDKCKFYQNEVRFLGKIISRDGIRLDESTTDAILKMPQPDDTAKLRSFLGHMSYVSRHVPDIRTARAPLDNLLKPDVKYEWNEPQQQSFDRCKQLAGNSALLTHFDSSRPIVLTTDASPYGLGACLSHKSTTNGKTRLMPIAYASASLKNAEKNYAQVDCEGLAIHWAIQHFRQYLWCQHFELHTDCSALVKIFGSKNDLGGMAAGRLNRWAAALMEYSFSIKHIKGKSNLTADSLSRLPVCEKSEIDNSVASAPYPVGSSHHRLSELSTMQQQVNFQDKSSQDASISISQQEIGQNPLCAWDILPLTSKDIAKATREDVVYGKLLNAIRVGALDHSDPSLKKFGGVFNELYIDNDVIHFGARVVIPTVQQPRLLQELHYSHIGIVKMKDTVRRYFWWPLVGKDIESMCNKCPGCRKYRRKPSPGPLCPWPFSTRPMERVHIDYLEYRGKMILLMIDSFSKRIWCNLMNTDTTATKTLAVLFGWFCDSTGFPTSLVSDNGPQFTAAIFKEKLEKWGIKHVLTPPYHPQSNGLAERAVGIVKSKLKKMDVSGSAIPLFIALKYIERIHGLTTHASTGRCPYELISQGPTPSLFPQIVGTQQLRRESNVTQATSRKLRRRKQFLEDDKVLVYNNHTKLSWEGIIQDVLGQNMYLVRQGAELKRISGDLISKVSAQQEDVGEEMDQEIGLEDFLDTDDTESVSSASSLGSSHFNDADFDAPGQENRNIGLNVQRRRQTRLESLGRNMQAQRLRPRR